MNETVKQQMEAVGVLKNFLDKLIPNLETLCTELKGQRKADTAAFQKECLDAFNWVIEVYNRIPDALELSDKKLDKGAVNQAITELAEALKAGEDALIAEKLENGVSGFLRELREITGIVEHVAESRE